MGLCRGIVLGTEVYKMDVDKLGFGVGILTSVHGPCLEDVINTAFLVFLLGYTVVVNTTDELQMTFKGIVLCGLDNLWNFVTTDVIGFFAVDLTDIKATIETDMLAAGVLDGGFLVTRCRDLYSKLGNTLVFTLDGDDNGERNKLTAFLGGLL